MRPVRPLALLLLCCALASCAIIPVPAAGGKDASQGLVLHMAQSDNLSPVTVRWYDVPRAFVANIPAVSGGHITVQLDSTTYADGSPDQESRLLRAVASGDVDAAFVPSRAFADAGIQGLGVLEAPFVISSLAAEQALVTSPIAATLLDRLRGTGIVGLGLAVGPLRRPASGGAPLLRPADFDDQDFRSYNSPIADTTIRLLGGRPQHVTYDWADRVRAGLLRGAEVDLVTVLDADRAHDMFMATNVVLWPKVYVLVASQQLWDRLDDQQRAWLKDAAERTRDESAAAVFDESQLAQEACAQGMTFATATDEDLAELTTAVAPQLATLAADPVLDQLRQIAAAHPAEPLQVGSTCFDTSRSGTSTANDGNEASEVHESVTTWPTTGPRIPKPPDGHYRIRVTEQELQAAGYSNGQGWSGEWDLIIRDHGTRYTLACTATGSSVHDCGNGAGAPGTIYEAGTVTATGHSLVLSSTPEAKDRASGCGGAEHDLTGCGAIDIHSLGRWHLDGDQLTFDAPPDGTGSTFWVHPWTRISR